MEGTHVYLWPIHTDTGGFFIMQNPPQYCNYSPIKISKFREK